MMKTVIHLTGNLKRICNNCGSKYDIKTGCTCESSKKKFNDGKKVWRTNNPETIRFFNSKRWKKLRVAIIQRDSGHCKRCFLKWNRINSVDLQVHHIKSREHYPELKWEESNLVTCCKTCNIQLGTTDKLDFKFTVPEVRDFNI